jgi:carboxymethylenebutenolidase
MYYGRVVTEPDQLASLTAPLLGHFGGIDTGIPVESAREFAAALSRRQHDATVYVYEGAGHAFASPTSGRYNKEAAELSWGRTIEFLSQHLR